MLISVMLSHEPRNTIMIVSEIVPLHSVAVSVLPLPVTRYHTPRRVLWPPVKPVGNVPVEVTYGFDSTVAPTTVPAVDDGIATTVAVEQLSLSGFVLAVTSIDTCVPPVLPP